MKNELKCIAGKLERMGLDFEEGILGGVGSGGGGYYDGISDKISGYNLDEFNEEEFNKWYDGFTIDSFNKCNTSLEDNEIEKRFKMEPGLYAIGGDGAIKIINDNEYELIAFPILTGNNFEMDVIFTLDKKGNVIALMSKEEVASRLKMNLEKKDTWSLI